MNNKEERARKLEQYGNAHQELTDALAAFPREMWHYKASFDPWSIQEIVVHITDSEANSFVRCRKFIAEPGSQVAAYDENDWAKGLDYSGQNPDDAVELFKWLRGNTYKLVKTLPESAWSNTIYHPENGIMTLDDWLDTYATHVSDHVAQMRRIHEDWASGSR
jgi:DinB superfamily